MVQAEVQPIQPRAIRAVIPCRNDIGFQAMGIGHAKLSLPSHVKSVNPAIFVDCVEQFGQPQQRLVGQFYLRHKQGPPPLLTPGALRQLGRPSMRWTTRTRRGSRRMPSRCRPRTRNETVTALRRPMRAIALGVSAMLRLHPTVNPPDGLVRRASAANRNGARFAALLTRRLVKDGCQFVASHVGQSKATMVGLGNAFVGRFLAVIVGT